ncbi:MAG: MBL fold hydrolase [Chloroflexi bacterium RBG_16_56_11]|nr:MAG: MBL fold hydrolase [Chloroflexi bacterium RBG_16_56_11]
MRPREIRKDVYGIGAVDWDRRLFDALIPLPDGTSYNSYLVKGNQKTVLIDTIDPSMREVLFANLDQLNVDHVDYVVFNHAEPDHSGSIVQVLAKYPEAVAVCSPRCQGLLTDRFKVSAEKFKTVEDKATISLGGRTLEFVHTPWVHWPETMVTYLREERILFSCDFFGSHLATTDMYINSEAIVHDSAKRYFAEIMMPFRSNIQKNLEKLKDYAIDIIAPSHGPMYDKPEWVIKAYQSWADDKPGNVVVIPYISMHGSTRKMVSYLVDALSRRGVTVQQVDLASVDLGKLAMSLVDAATIVIGTPTVLTGPHPAAAYAVFLANALKPRAKYASVIGAYGWGGKAVEQIAAMLPNLKVEFLPPVLAKGSAGEAEFRALDELAENIARKHQEAGLTRA